MDEIKILKIFEVPGVAREILIALVKLFEFCKKKCLAMSLRGTHEIPQKGSVNLVQPLGQHSLHINIYIHI